MTNVIMNWNGASDIILEYFENIFYQYDAPLSFVTKYFLVAFEKVIKLEYGRF